MNANDDMADSKRIKLCISTGMWQRPAVFEMFAEGVDFLRKTFIDEVDIHCAVAGSEGELSKKLCLSYKNFHYVEAPNQPLGVKMNKSLEVARSLNPDYCLMVGSDDLIGKNLMEKYISVMNQGIDFSFLTDCYFFDTVSKQGLYWAGYSKPNNKGNAAGIGKLISRSLLDKIKWNCFPPGFDRILDTGFDRQIQKVQHTSIPINLKEENLFALDIKSATNMTPFNRWDNCNFMDGYALLFENLPEHLATKIYGKQYR